MMQQKIYQINNNKYKTFKWINKNLYKKDQKVEKMYLKNKFKQNSVIIIVSKY